MLSAYFYVSPVFLDSVLRFKTIFWAQQFPIVRGMAALRRTIGAAALAVQLLIVPQTARLPALTAVVAG